MNLASHYRRSHSGINIGEKDQSVINEAEAWKVEATKQLKKLAAAKQRKRKSNSSNATGRAKRRRTQPGAVNVFAPIVVPPPLDLTSLGGSAAADNDVVMDDAVMNNDIANLETGLQAAEQQETTTTTQQETTTTTQQHGQTEVSVPGTIAGGLHTNIYNVELGHDVRVKIFKHRKSKQLKREP